MVDARTVYDTEEHPAFTLAKSLPEPWRTHFPKSTEEAKAWKKHITRYALASSVLVVANTRVECAWCAYCGAVMGRDHNREQADVLLHGTKISEEVARILFPQFKDIPYAY